MHRLRRQGADPVQRSVLAAVSGRGAWSPPSVAPAPAIVNQRLEWRGGLNRVPYAPTLIYEPGRRGEMYQSITAMTYYRAKSFEELIIETNWESYGTGNYEKCADCMVHSGYEATAVDDTLKNPLKALRVFLRGPKTTGKMSPEVPFLYEDTQQKTVPIFVIFNFFYQF